MYDAIVLGTGGVGSAALFHLARRGARVLGLDRFSPPHDRGSSHGQTRIIRQAYFEHPDYVPLLLRAYELWEELSELAGEQLYYETGLLQIGPRDGVVLRGVLESARRHALTVDQLSAPEINARFPGFRANEEWSGVLEHRAGFLLVERCVEAHLDAARAAGAELKTSITVHSWKATGDHVVLETDAGSFLANRLVVTAGPWAGEFLSDLGIRSEVRRKSQFWFEPLSQVYTRESGCPAFLFETPSGIFYGFPQIDHLGIKIAEHSGGQSMTDPLLLGRAVHPDDERSIRSFCATHLPQLSGTLTHHAACMYTMSPDEHFVVDRHPKYPHVAFAAGLSGHGFKFTPVLGQALCDLSLDGRTTLPIEFLSCHRPVLKRTSAYE